jgi:hypothetical protein
LEFWLISKERHFKKAKKKGLQRDIKSPWSLSYGHLLETPFHTAPKKVRG